MLIHHLSGRPSEWCLASHHYPERYAKRIQIRADVCTDSRELLWTGKFRCTSKASRHGDSGLRAWFIDQLGQPKVNDFSCYRPSLLQAYHDIAWFDIPMNELLLVDGTQTGSHLR